MIILVNCFFAYTLGAHSFSSKKLTFIFNHLFDTCKFLRYTAQKCEHFTNPSLKMVIIISSN